MRPAAAEAGAADPIIGLAPVIGPAPRLLILGSMPGVASLEAGRYYAHPRNAFWPILGELIGLDPVGDYAARCRTLVERGIALWDVVAECVRPGSLDARIAAGTVKANPIDRLLASEPGLSAIAFNGRTAEQLFRRHLLPRLPRPVALLGLPSTSPAHAALDRAAKLERWRGILRHL